MATISITSLGLGNADLTAIGKLSGTGLSQIEVAAAVVEGDKLKKGNKIVAYDGHLASTSNPHSTTANQVGAYSKIEVDNLLTNTETLLANKVDKVTGKGLSTNDFTDTFKQALELKKVQDISTDSVTKKLVVSYTDDTVANLSINDIVTDVKVSGATLDATTNVLTLTSTDGGADVTVDLSDFVSSGELTSALSEKADYIHSHLTSDIIDLDDTLSNLATDLSNKQDNLVSGTSIKTINGESVLGSGNIVITGGGSGGGDGSIINKPVIISPANLTVDYIGAVISTYNTSSFYEGLQTRVIWECALDETFTNVIDRYEGSDNLTSWTPNVGELETTQVFIRTKQISEGHISNYSAVVSFTTPDIYVVTPTLTVSGQPSGIGKNPTLTTSAFTIYNGTDTQASADYQVIRNSDNEVVWESIEDTSNLLSITTDELETSTEYTFRARHNSTNYGSSAWVEVIGTTKSQFTISAGIQGTKGFSVAPTDQPFALLGLAEMTGTNDPTSDNYGNYIHTNGSIVCWLPKTLYRVGHPDSSRFATYGANALDMVGTDVFATEAEANGYALPRCFINGGKEQAGVFVDKYTNSKDGNSASKSVFGGVPIGLSTSYSGGTVSQGMTGCTGIFADAVVLSKARGERWNATSAFIYGYLALVSVAQAQAATSTADVAWYDATGVKNYPKGCNNNALSDVDDTTVVYASAGDSSYPAKPKTGATANFAKTTHNGSNNGVADLNGGMFEVTIGITNFGDSATATTAIANDTIYVLKHSTDIATLTAGWNGATDVWGNAANLATKYDSVTSPHPLGSSTGNVYWGNSTNAVLQNDLNGVSRDVCGFIPKNSSSTGATGANLFGNDYLNKYNRQNMVPLACGHWNYSAHAGVFHRSFSYYRSYSNYAYGFRASAYFL